ncbi:hypothetical protein ACKI1I_40900 [Streptomyces turgidiscabies]|uniref:Ankyrin n=1 Tax=Streptomyces turgidiscabies (strain Car8) TaxID=698760 RepID=L7EZZ9_STRT8|nr:hypothetical protein STRTUCAR8_03719 [Streptomyces turgidiscabies Car8]GAQ68680.1 hypothetical protein T45_00395 [Streptomyces turgidiscabies]
MYETHITVRCGTSAETERLGRWASAAGLKLTHIVLARGRMPAQPMLTLSGSPSFADESARARKVAALLRADGFEPVRVKIESSPWAPEVPSEPCLDERYFEHHVKLRLTMDADLETLAARVVPHGAHLSWNARRVARSGRRTERFVTQRCRGVDAAGAGRALERLLAELRGSTAAVLPGLEVIGVEREFVLYDSDLSVDDGWIEESGDAVVAASEVRG